VYPVRFTPPAGRLLGLDRTAAVLAELPGDVGGVIFCARLALVEVGSPNALGPDRRDITRVYEGTSHLASFARLDAK
jgi:hypothetical protein